MPWNYWELLDESEVLNTIITGHDNLSSVSCSSEEEIWISKESEEIRCFNKNTVKTKLGEGPNNIAADTEGALLYTNWKTNTICKVKNAQEEEFIT